MPTSHSRKGARDHVDMSTTRTRCQKLLPERADMLPSPSLPCPIPLGPSSFLQSLGLARNHFSSFAFPFAPRRRRVLSAYVTTLSHAGKATLSSTMNSLSSNYHMHLKIWYLQRRHTSSFPNKKIPYTSSPHPPKFWST